MGVGTRDSKVYLQVADGKIVQSFKTPQPDAHPRVNKKGVTVYERRYDYIEGIIKSIDTREHEYGKDYLVIIEDGGDAYQLSINYSSRYATSFLKCLPNLDLSAPVKIQPYKMADRNDKSKSVTGIVMYQGAGKVAPYYTKEEPNGLPQMQQVKFKGQLVWDSSEMDAFLENMAKNIFKKQADIPQRPAPSQKPEANNDNIDASPEDDDLPF